jgi:hypothetical protein
VPGGDVRSLLRIDEDEENNFVNCRISGQTPIFTIYLDRSTSTTAEQKTALESSSGRLTWIINESRLSVLSALKNQNKYIHRPVIIHLPLGSIFLSGGLS